MTGKDPQVREPATEIVETPDGARVTVELPGVAQDAIRIAVSKDILKLEADGSRGKFSTIQALPFEPDPEGISVTFSQGVLEIMMGRKPDDVHHDGEKNVPVAPPVDLALQQLETELDQARKDLIRVSGERSALEERVSFLQRDFQNLKRRHEGEKESIADKKIEELSVGLMDILDSFILARGSTEKAAGSERTIDRMLKGIEMIECQVISLFQRIGITSMEVEGLPFDHNFHEAVGFSEREDLDDEVIVNEVRKGYVYRGRAIRPARVIVNRKPVSVVDEGKKKSYKKEKENRSR